MHSILSKILKMFYHHFQSGNQALNMRKFYSDNAFLGQPFYVSIARHNLFKEVTKIITENIPQVSALEFSENKICRLDGFGSLSAATPNVKILYLEENLVS